MTPESIEFDAVRPDDAPAVPRCPYCERPFDADRSRDLHVGEDHRDEWTDAEATAYDEAVEAEEAELWAYHVTVVVALSVTYTVVVLAYMVVFA